jgi:hypothetical protein
MGNTASLISHQIMKPRNESCGAFVLVAKSEVPVDFTAGIEAERLAHALTRVDDERLQARVSTKGIRSEANDTRVEESQPFRA